jgi:acyl-CoA thioester hydrolase
MVRRIMSTYISAYDDVVRPEWIDNNGHMNLAYYVLIFDLATDRLFDRIGVGTPYRTASGNSTFAAEAHTIYEREVHLGDNVQVRTILLGADSKRIHFFHEMFHTESGERSATQELMSLHIDMNVRKVAPFPPDLEASLAALAKEYAPSELPKGAGRRIAMPARR